MLINISISWYYYPSSVQDCVSRMYFYRFPAVCGTRKYTIE